MSSADRTLACVFSYNHAALLRNCIASIRRQFPALAIVVFDDGSDDPAVAPALDAIEKEPDISVLRSAIKRGDPASAWSLDGETADLRQPHPLLLEHERQRLLKTCEGWAQGNAPSSRHGNFYLHQKLAMRLAIERGYRFAWTIEADMQRVAGDDAWLDETLAKFDRDPAVCQISVQMLTRPSRFNFKLLRPDGVYQPPRAYNSNGLLHLDRLRERPALVDAVCDEAPAGNLKLTSYRWHTLGAKCWFDAYPVQAHVPWPDAFREGRAALADGTLAIEPLAGRAAEAWRQRDPAIPPMAEYFLTLNYKTDVPGPPWWYNPAFLERYLELCKAHEREAHASGLPTPRFPEGDAATPVAHYWQPTAEEAQAAAAPPLAQSARPLRLRDRLRWCAPLLWMFSAYKAMRLRAKRLGYGAFRRRVAREREYVLSGGVPDASRTQRRRG